MPKKIPEIPGLEDYGDDEGSAPAVQTQRPKSLGGVAPQSTATGQDVQGIPGLKDYGTKSAAATSTPEDSLGDGTWSSWLHDATHPQKANLNRPQTWRDWFTKTYNPSAKDVGNAALDDVSFGGADYVQSKLPTALGGDDLASIRARTADSQAAMGPAGPLLNAATYAVPGLGEYKAAAAIPGRALGVLAKRAAPVIGRYGAGAAEGGTAAALSTIGHEVGGDKGGYGGVNPLDVAKSFGVGAGVGVGGQAVADVLTPGLRWTGDNWANRPGRSGEAQAAPLWANWREQAKTDPTGVQADIQRIIALDPQSPRVAPLQDLHDSLNQSVEPGAGANAVKAAATLGGGYAGWEHLNNVVEGIGGASASGWLAKNYFDPFARKVNTLDRDINVGKAFDRNYAPATNRPAVTGDSSGWADLIRQGIIGANQPQF